MDASEIKDISGRWNDTDSRLVAEEMIRDCLSADWLSKASSEGGKAPTVIVGRVRNQSHEHINTEAFIEDIQKSLTNSGKVAFVASKKERGALRQEKLDQDVFASEDSRKDFGQETGADYMLSGVINTIQDREGGKSVMYYQTNLKLLDIKTNQIVWNGEKKIKKLIKRASVTF
jgi:uncharacterized protein (TIGR02722 family)